MSGSCDVRPGQHCGGMCVVWDQGAPVSSEDAGVGVVSRERQRQPRSWANGSGFFFSLPFESARFPGQPF